MAKKDRKMVPHKIEETGAALNKASSSKEDRKNRIPTRRRRLRRSDTLSLTRCSWWLGHMKAR